MKDIYFTKDENDRPMTIEELDAEYEARRDKRLKIEIERKKDERKYKKLMKESKTDRKIRESLGEDRVDFSSMTIEEINQWFKDNE